MDLFRGEFVDFFEQGDSIAAFQVDLIATVLDGAGGEAIGIAGI